MTPATIRRVVMVAKIGSPEGRRIASALADWLERNSVQVVYDETTAAALDRGSGEQSNRLPSDVDLAIVAGGDGTLLSVARSAAPLQIPVLGINFGSLGFLTELQPDEQFAGLRLTRCVFVAALVRVGMTHGAFTPGPGSRFKGVQPSICPGLERGRSGGFEAVSSTMRSRAGREPDGVLRCGCDP